MKIRVAPITNRFDEWQPQNRVYFTSSIISDIFEKYLPNLYCIQGVGFNATNQEFTNVLINCSNLNIRSGMIFLVKDDNDNFFWTFVTDFTLEKDSRTQYNVTLQIDVITSNYAYFNSNMFKGQAYIERTNNQQRSVNNIHSTTCSSVTNDDDVYSDSNIPFNKDIDIFADYKIPQKQEKEIYTYDVLNDSKRLVGVFTVEPKGEILVSGTPNDFSLFAYKSTISLSKFFGKGRMNTNEFSTLKELLVKYAYKTEEKDSDYCFSWRNGGDQFINLTPFSNEITNKGGDSTVISQVDEFIKDVNVNFWLSIPKIFNVGNNIISNFEIDLSSSFLKDIDLKNHLNLHKQYYLIYERLVKIQIDLLKFNLKTFKIYGTRIINKDGAIFKFYYFENRLDEFYNINLTLTNGLPATDYQDYLNQLNVAYNSGLKGIGNNFQDIFREILGGFVGFAGGEGFGLFNLLTNTIGLPFAMYKDYKNEQYQKMLIQSKPTESKNTLLLEALNTILHQEVTILDFAYFTVTADSSAGQQIRDTGYGFLEKSKFENSESISNFWFLVLSPIEDDIEKINNDQNEYGNVMNELNLSIKNILDDSNVLNHLFWQGKIQPDYNPVNPFMLDLINETLAQGIKIWKTKPEIPTLIKK